MSIRQKTKEIIIGTLLGGSLIIVLLGFAISVVAIARGGSF